MKRCIVIFAIVISTGLAHAWPSCQGSWNQVPAGTTTANGAIYHGDGLTWQCQSIPQSMPLSASSSSTSTSSSQSVSSSSSQSSSSASQKQSQDQTQNQTATGGDATAVSTGGNNSNNSKSVTNVAAPKIPVSTAWAPPNMSTSNCFKGYGAGVQTMPVGVSLGGGKIDENCRALETAKFAPNRVTFCKIYVELKDAKKAGVTLDDCMDSEAQVALDPPTPVIPAVAPAPAPAPAREIVVIHDILPDRLEALPQVIQAPVASHKKRHNKSPVCPDRPTGEK